MKIIDSVYKTCMIVGASNLKEKNQQSWYRARDVFIIDIEIENDQSIISGELSCITRICYWSYEKWSDVKKNNDIRQISSCMCISIWYLVGFTAFSAKQSENPQDIVGCLHSLYLKFDKFVVKYV